MEMTIAGMSILRSWFIRIICMVTLVCMVNMGKPSKNFVVGDLFHLDSRQRMEPMGVSPASRMMRRLPCCRRDRYMRPFRGNQSGIRTQVETAGLRVTRIEFGNGVVVIAEKSEGETKLLGHS